MSDDKAKSKTANKRKANYDEKLKIKGSLFDVLKVAVTPAPQKDKGAKSKKANE